MPILERRALLLKQHPKHPVYIFSLAPTEILSVASISRISRDESGKVIGYQRPEVKSHVSDIREYLDSGSVIFPNPIILAFHEAPKFRRSRGMAVEDGLSLSGILEVPIYKNDNYKSAWIVDGQQRALALDGCKNKNLSVPVVGFVVDGVELQRDQFLRVNNTKPLPRGLITELLPEVDTTLPRKLAVRKLPSAICSHLNSNPNSPFFELIKRPSIQGKQAKSAVVIDTSVVDMIKDRLKLPTGALFPYHNLATGETETELVIKVLIAYWTAVKNTFPDAWGKKSSQSRLMHGVGIKSMGNLMDVIMSHIDPNDENMLEYAEGELRKIKSMCRWTSGTWDGLGLMWNDIENTNKFVKLLTNYLIREYHLKGRRL